MQFEYNNEKCEILYDIYVNGRLAVIIRTLSGEPMATLSCNIPEIDLEPDEFIVKNYSENHELAQICEKFFENTGRVVESKYVTMPIWKLKAS